MIFNQETMSKSLYFTTIFMLVCQFMINNLGLPSEITIVMDLFIILGAVFYLRNLPKWVRNTGTLWLFWIAVSIFAVAAFGMIWAGSSIRHYLAGLRLNGRYFVLFFVCAFTFTRQRILSLIKLLKVFLWLNVVMCSIQYFIFGFKGDACGGFFSTAYTNSWTNIFLCILTAYAMSLYIHKKMNLKELALICIPSIYIAALAEIKFYYFELAILFILMMMLTKPDRKKIVLGVVGILLMLALSWLVDVLWTAGSSNAFTIEGIKYYFSEKAYGYSAVGDWGRIGGIANADKMFFKNSFNLFGRGLGSCGYGTSFQATYGYLHYIWFAYLHIYLEMGWAGLTLYIAFFVMAFITSRRLRKKMGEMDPMDSALFLVSECMMVLGVILIFYNTTVKNYPAYFLFMSMAFPFAIYAQHRMRKPASAELPGVPAETAEVSPVEMADD